MRKKIFLIFSLTGIIFTACAKEPLPDKQYLSILPQAGLQELALWDPPENTVYIDPNNRNDPHKNGSKEHPFSSFDEVTWADGKVYALKRGTSLHSGSIMLHANDVTLASYGEGKRPSIISTSDFHAVSTDWGDAHNVTIRDIEVYAPDAVSGIIIRNNSTNAKIINCKIHGPQWGIRALTNIDGLLIHNTEIFNIADDGIFIREARNIEISHCYIHKVNQNWKPPYTPESEAAGDGIQLYLCNHWHLHHNIIDRSDTGNKFCFISNNPEQNDGIIEYNIMIGPQNNGSAIYLGDGRDLIIRYNYVSGNSQSPLWSHAVDLQIYYNIFDQVNGPLLVSGSAMVYNNLFYQMPMGIEGGSITARNNIFDLVAVNSPRFKVDNLTESHNLFTLGLPTPNSIIGNPGFIDPDNKNFRLTPESIAINKGLNVGITEDMDGNPVPGGEAPDIGPYEFQDL